MNRPLYNAEDYRREIERIERELSECADEARHKTLTTHLSAVKAHLVEAEGGEPVGFKW